MAFSQQDMSVSDQSFHLDSRYAVQTENSDVPWWTTADGNYGVNILGTYNILKE